jgi:hypothetical protein
MYQLTTNEENSLNYYKYYLMAGICDPCLRLTTLLPACANCLEIAVASVLYSPQGLSKDVYGFFPFTIVIQGADTSGCWAEVMGLRPLTVWNYGPGSRRVVAVCLLCVLGAFR